MIDFSTLQGLTIPEGVVTQITDASGRVIWAVKSDEPIFVPLYDFGTIENTTSGIGGYMVTQYNVDVTFDFNEPTHMMVNGEIFEIAYFGAASRHDYKMVGDTGFFVSATYPYSIFFPQNASGSGWNASFSAYTGGTYTVILGKYE